MALTFSLTDFFSPWYITKFRSEFTRNQRLGIRALENQVSKRLRKVLIRALRTVPFYSDILDPCLIDQTKDTEELLAKFPILTKQILQEAPTSLLASDSTSMRAGQWVSTSGSSGQPLRIFMGKEANAMEFNYYWRYWGWSGYSLGDRFAELSSVFFLNKQHESYMFQRLYNRLLLNSITISEERAAIHSQLLNRYKPAFIKGAPSALLALASLMPRNTSYHFPLKAIFTTGEFLSNSMRSHLEEAYETKIVDSYGQMERVAAICQCNEGSYHINIDYGFVELIPATGEEGTNLYRVIGSSMYNDCMPLIRYDTGDLVELPSDMACECGLPFPVVKKIVGRSSDVIQLRDGRVLTAPYVLLDEISGVSYAQLVQHSHSKIRLLLCPIDSQQQVNYSGCLTKLEAICAGHAEINVEFVAPSGLVREQGAKLKPVVLMREAQ